MRLKTYARIGPNMITQERANGVDGMKKSPKHDNNKTYKKLAINQCLSVHICKKSILKICG